MSPEQWKFEPFSAHKEPNGDIYGRGTQVYLFSSLFFYGSVCCILKQLYARKVKNRNNSFDLGHEMCWNSAS